MTEVCVPTISLPDGYRLVHLGDNSVVGQDRWEATLHAPSDHPDYYFDTKYGQAVDASQALLAAIASVPRPTGRRRQTCDEISPMLREFFAANLQPKPAVTFPNLKVRL